MRGSLYDSLGNLGNLSGNRLDFPGVLFHFFHAIAEQQFQIIFLALAYAVADCDNLVFLYIHHRVFLYEARIILECDKICRLIRYIEQQREGGRVLQVLHLAFCRGHGGSLRCSFYLIVLRLHGPLIG